MQWYGGLKFRDKVGKFYGPIDTRENGSLQGCVHSVDDCDALLSEWLDSVKGEVDSEEDLPLKRETPLWVTEKTC